MPGVAHIVLHALLCASARRAPQSAAIPLRVVLAYAVRQPEMDRTFHVVRETPTTATVEFDAPQGVYNARVSVRNVRGCVGSEFLAVLPERDREITVDLSRANQPMSPALLAGDAPAYVDPTIVLFGAATTCNNPVGMPTNDVIDAVTESQAFYANIYSPAAIADRRSRVVALRLTDSSGGYHYIRLPVDFPMSPNAWPFFQLFNITTDVIDFAAGKPEDVLLCPRLQKTSAG